MSETMEKKLAEYREIARYGIAVGIGGGLLTEVLDHIDAIAAQLVEESRRNMEQAAQWNAQEAGLRAQLATANERVAQLEEQARDFHNVDDVLRLREAAIEAGPKCKRCGDTGWLDGDPVRGISDEPCGCDETWEE